MRLSNTELLRFHRSMLVDTNRLEAFQRAIAACVRRGDTVLDLGSGSGVLAILAARAGARVVYAVEATGIMEIARRIARQNDVEDRIVFIDDHSTRARLPERVDVLITETIGNLGFDEGILGWVKDARRRLLKPQAVIVPKSIELLAVPLETPDAYIDEVDWKYDRAGIDFRAMRPFAVNNIYWRRIEPASYLASPRSLGAVGLAGVESTTFSGDAVFEVTRAGRLHGLGGWFKSRLCDGVSLSNDPALPVGSWNHAFLPFEETVPVVAGDRLAVRVSCSNNGSVWRWRAEFESRADGADGDSGMLPQFDQSTFFGAPATPDSLHMRAEGYRPELNLDGRVASFILDRMDGRRTLEELAELALERFPERFSDAADALEHVRTISADLGH